MRAATTRFTRFRLRRAAALGAAVLAALSAGAHAIRHRPVEGGAGVRAEYDNGEPAAWCGVRVLAPGETDPFLEGTTDRNGVVVFAPDRDGEWTVEIDDGLGHRLEAKIRVADGVVRMGAKASFGSRCHGIVAGVGLVFGIFGLKAMKRARANSQPGTV